MNWNNPELNEIQAIENALINSVNCGSNSKLFSGFIHTTKQFTNPQLPDKNLINYKPIKLYYEVQKRGYKYYTVLPNEMDKIVKDVAKLIEEGNNLNVACTLAGYTYNVLRPKFTSDHKQIFATARKIKYSNK